MPPLRTPHRDDPYDPGASRLHERREALRSCSPIHEVCSTPNFLAGNNHYRSPSTVGTPAVLALNDLPGIYLPSYSHASFERSFFPESKVTQRSNQYINFQDCFKDGLGSLKKLNNGSEFFPGTRPPKSLILTFNVANTPVLPYPPHQFYVASSTSFLVIHPTKG